MKVLLHFYDWENHSIGGASPQSKSGARGTRPAEEAIRRSIIVQVKGGGVKRGDVAIPPWRDSAT